MASNTTYNPPNENSFIKTALNFNAQGISSTIAHGTTQHVDYTFTDDMLITGLEVIINNGNYGDTVELQVVDTTGVTGYPIGTVLNQFVTNWYVPPTADTQFNTVYPAKVITGLTLRAIYNSTGSSDVFFAVNYKLHKILF